MFFLENTMVLNSLEHLRVLSILRIHMGLTSVSFPYRSFNKRANIEYETNEFRCNVIVKFCEIRPSFLASCASFIKFHSYRVCAPRSLATVFIQFFIGQFCITAKIYLCLFATCPNSLQNWFDQPFKLKSRL